MVEKSWYVPMGVVDITTNLLARWFLCRMNMIVVNFPARTSSSRFANACKNGDFDKSDEALDNNFGFAFLTIFPVQLFPCLKLFAFQRFSVATVA